MAKRSEGFNLSAAVRDFRKGHRGASVKTAFEALQKAHPGEKINEGTFKTTFYKLSGGREKKKSVIKRKPRGTMTGGDSHAESIMRAGLTFIRLAGGVESARERLVGLEELIETAKSVE